MTATPTATPRPAPAVTRPVDRPTAQTTMSSTAWIAPLLCAFISLFVWVFHLAHESRPGSWEPPVVGIALWLGPVLTGLGVLLWVLFEGGRRWDNHTLRKARNLLGADTRNNSPVGPQR